MDTISLTWLQKHERLILGTMVLGVCLFLGNRWLDRSAADAEAKAAAAAQVVAVQDAASKALAQQSAQQTALLTAQLLADKQEMAKLVDAVASRDAASAKKVTEVQGAKTPPQAVADLESVYHLVMPIVPTDIGAVVPTQDLQQFTVAKIEGDTAKADLLDTKTQLTTAQREITNCEAVVVTLQRQTAQDQIDLKAHDDRAAADLKAAKTGRRKSLWRTFWAGFAAGFISRQVIKP